MDLSRVWDVLKNLETKQVINTLQEWKIGDLIHNPWFLGGMVALALLALFMRWRMFLAAILAVTGFAWLLSYTMARGTEVTEVYSDTLLIFVGGGVLLMAFVIYLLFIKSD